MMTESKLKICSVESRRGDDMKRMIERFGGDATIAPSMREVPIEEHTEAFAFGEQLLAGKIDIVIFMTGVGARYLMDTLCTQHTQEEILAALAKCVLIVRGPKPTAVLREWKLKIDHRAPEPNTWRELLATIKSEVDVQEKTIALQEYGRPNDELSAALEELGADVQTVSIYRWALPEDITPLESTIHGLIQKEFDCLLLTSAQQVNHLLEVAEQMGQQSELLPALKTTLIGSIGPTCTEELVRLDLSPAFEASPPKMGQLVKMTFEKVPQLLTAKDSLPS
ncbi:uroporphyrinogen-III synthase [Calycomorphotria hydatis]|uniref:Bifunctional uroporphyrinogen-III synthetase/response regulator domain protein n=1 Tax=Calycomorphotria hydatis TaxID=2528027 RepID=A0A517T9K5_9PLAN|nr:uroporphyrinogen-III synthase [Calycomorphotria hydatis]QDT65046.1 bifunctional uroporphyrinogen-III synthetase/response regulator domain protein [Calycomorphotria hydatis]